MVKINHNRPSLRYLDNLRRELARENRPSPTWFHPENIEAHSMRFEREESFPAYVLAFAKLPERQQQIAGCAIDAFCEYMDASTKVISLVLGGKSKAKKFAKREQEETREALTIQCAVLASTIMDDLAAGRSGFWDWFQDFYANLDNPSKWAWTDFGEMLLEEGLPLYMAQQMSDDPERVQELRKYLTSED
jgi:hypothetical protein